MKRCWSELLNSFSGGFSIKAGVFALSCLMAFQAHAQDAKTSPSSPVGGTWESKVSTSDADGSNLQTLSVEQAAAIDVINSYFNALNNLKGRFVQIDPDQKKTKGTFYVQKPGKFRFDYASPSRKIIISDGRLLAIQDLDLRNEDIYELDNTPFRILLKENVNIIKDARILDVMSSDTQVSATLSDKNPDAVGQITIVIGLQPEPTLLGWTTADVQGQKTTVTVSNLTKPDQLKSDLFKREELFKDAAIGGP